MLAFLLHSSIGSDLSLTTAEHVFNSLMPLVPVNSRFTSRFYSHPVTLPVLHQQFSFLAQQWCSYSSQERRCWSCCLVSSKLHFDVEPGMEVKFECWQKWGMSLLHLVQWQFLGSYYLHWYSESSHQHHS